MLDLLKAAEKENRSEEEIIKIFNQFVKKLVLTNEKVRENNQMKKYNLAAISSEKETKQNNQQQSVKNSKIENEGKENKSAQPLIKEDDKKASVLEKNTPENGDTQVAKIDAVNQEVKKENVFTYIKIQGAAGQSDLSPDR